MADPKALRKARKAADPEKDNFTSVMDRNWKAVYDAAFSICFDETLSTEASARTFLLLERKMRTSEKTFVGIDWMRETVGRHLRKLLREAAAQEMKRPPEGAGERHGDPASVDLSFEAIDHLSYDVAFNDDVFRRLTAVEKAVIHQTYSRMATPAEIAEELGIPPEAVTEMKTRGLRKIADSMAFYGKIG